jgi:ATP-dependent Clp protease ATP-binding subunit ClpC
MMERFTDRARKVMQLANQEALRFNHEYVGTEHVLLGLCKEGSGVAANVLKNLDVNLHKIRLEVEKIVQPGPEMTGTMGKLPQTPRTKQAIEYSISYARELGHNYLGTEHLLLGLLRVEEGVAAQVLMNLGVSLASVREECLLLLGQPTSLEEATEESDAANYVSRIKEICCKLPPKQAWEQIVAAVEVFQGEIREKAARKLAKDIEKLGGEPLGDTL